jgi:hypothetical protein
MASRRSDNRQRDLDDELERYRAAAMAALKQLEWCAGYLREIQKAELAIALDRNRKEILQRIG